MWYQSLTEIKSLGAQSERPGSLAGLAELRKKTLSQYFTPQNLVAFIWHLMGRMSSGISGRKINIFDNSIGVGSMVWPADPMRHRIFGFDVHSDSINALVSCLDDASFSYDVRIASLDQMSVRDGKFDFALINPPFSIPVSSPNLAPYPSCTWGRFGEKSSSVSHRYALDQAVHNSVCTIAVLPMNQVKAILKDKSMKYLNLCAVYELPINAFADQGVLWPMSICVFAQSNKRVITEVLDDNLEPSQYPKLSENQFSVENKPRIKHIDYDISEPSIKTPVTGERTVNVAKNGRKVILKYHCGLVQAKVENAILRRRAIPAPKSRLPKSVKFAGQGVLDFEVFLMQDDPIASFKDKLVYLIQKAGGVPVVDPGVWGYLRNQNKRNQRTKLSMGQVILDRRGNNSATVVKDFLLDENSIISPVMEKGMDIDLIKENGQYFVEYEGTNYLVDERKFGKELKVHDESMCWVDKYPSKELANSELGKMYRAKIKQLRIDQWFDREYQIDDLIEHMITPSGSICGWQMALGKTRLGVALTLLHGAKHTLIILEPHLIHDFMNQIKDDLSEFVDLNDVQVINKPEHTKSLKKINFIQLSRLRMLMNPKKSKNRTYARALRRRCGLVICDEAEFLANFYTNQSRAVQNLSPKKMIAMSGTIMPNYPRNIHPVLNFVAGDGTAVQPWGYYNGKLEKHFINSMDGALTGPKAFKDAFVSIVWCCYQFESTLKGARREIPRISNLPEYRKMISPFLKRRVTDEPAVRKYINIPKPNIKEVFLDWNIDHLKFYLNVAERFAQEWKKAHADASHMASLLPRISAVIKASNTPQFGVGSFGKLHGNMPKDDWSINQLIDWSNQGFKSILFTESPKVVIRLAKQLNDAGIKTIELHGGVNHKRRSELLNDQFKNGDVSVCLASKGCLNSGENVPQASKIVFYERSWSAKIEAQCFSRVLRQQQVNDVEIVFLHYEGGIDCYQRQMVLHKQDSANAGLDYADPQLVDSEFLHMEKIFYQFIQDLPYLQQQYLEKAA